jgi:UDP-N-acetylglucosamine diphosphorylase / glucose-1-phosphate thymidylyltransferase / UDP-N-acetylgalactosamine diphosphorylase / glucosamine-1-phosphate N-acetyltransferase / galactosamine-1-phosphate N-acetyltransferase
MQPSSLLDLTYTAHIELFDENEPVWAALTKIPDYLKRRLEPGGYGVIHSGAHVGPEVYLGEGTVVEPGAVIKGPAWIGDNCQIRSGCYIRENVIVGNGAVLGNSCEFKNCVIFDECEVPHFNYVGDSILGFKAHLGAGVILSNVRLDRGEVIVRTEGETMLTGLRKFGAIIGDYAEIGCNSCINPGSIIGQRSVVYPLSNFAGFLPPDSLLKTRQTQMVVPRVY